MKKNISIILYIGFLIVFLTGCGTCSKDLLETVKSPNNKYILNTYLQNCGATVDFNVTAELCNKKNECKEIYNVYHERDSFVYWIDNNNVFINGKKLNIHKDKYKSYDDEDYQDKLFELYSNDDFEVYIIDKSNNEKQISKEEVGYIIEAMKKYKFKSIEDYNNNYEYKLKVIDRNKTVENNTEIYDLVFSNVNSISIVKENQYIRLNRTDTEFIKRAIKNG